ncbi:MAG: GNAT family N-acetyltransferase [Crocinitomicaceae bacterium]|nr:GNAT family N-acetyltransferase [Crocinitomicaceae bacterium]
MLRIQRTDTTHKDFEQLERELDAYLKVVDGDDHAFYDQYNHLESIKHIVLAYFDEEPVGCGAFKEYSKDTIEIKRMFVNANFRGKGIATQLLFELEDWARELNFTTSLLETGKKQLEAVELYKSKGYTLIPNYGQYALIENSLCFEKQLNNDAKE